MTIVSSTATNILFSVRNGSTEKVVLTLRGEAALDAINNLVGDESAEYIAERIASCQWDVIDEGDTFSVAVFV